MTPLPLYLYIFPLASQPHINAFAENFGPDDPTVFSLLLDLRRGQPIQYGLDGRACILEPDLLQFTAVHELYPLAEFAFLKALQIRHLKMLVCHTEAAVLTT